jgi:hypothetical protein
MEKKRVRHSNEGRREREGCEADKYTPLVGIREKR